MHISVLSSDELFAFMLRAEIESMGSDYSVSVNEYKTRAEERGILIVDLDSSYASEGFLAEYVIGFSRNEESLSKDILFKCNSVLHRPFIVDDLKKSIKEIALGEKLPEEKAQDEQSGVKNEVFTKGLVLDGSDSSVCLEGRKIHLSGNEYAVLSKLNENAFNPVSRDELNKVLSSSCGNMCDVYICHLRTKLEADRGKRLIFTVRGKGYMLKI